MVRGGLSGGMCALGRVGRPPTGQGSSPDTSPAAMDDYPLPSRLELPAFAPPAQLAWTIYPSEDGVTEEGASGRRGQGRGPHMLSTAVRIQLDPHRNVKVQARLLPAHLFGQGSASQVPGAPVLTLPCPPGVPGDPAAAQGHPAPPHGPAGAELALPGEPRGCSGQVSRPG